MWWLLGSLAVFVVLIALMIIPDMIEARRYKRKRPPILPGADGDNPGPNKFLGLWGG